MFYSIERNTNLNDPKNSTRVSNCNVNRIIKLGFLRRQEEFKLI